MFMRMKKKEPEDPIKGGTIGPDLPDSITCPDQ
jgi:rubredoxin